MIDNTPYIPDISDTEPPRQAAAAITRVSKIGKKSQANKKTARMTRICAHNTKYELEKLRTKEPSLCGENGTHLKKTF